MQGLSAISLMLLVVGALSGCRESAAQSSAGRVPSDSTVDGWRRDLAYFATELVARHANAFHTTSREQFDREVGKLHDALPAISEQRRLLEFARLGALIGDGHTGVFLFSNRLFPGRSVTSWRRLPLEFWRSRDTIVVLGAGRRLEWMNGRVVTHVEGAAVQQVLDSLVVLASADNDIGRARNALMYLAIPEILHGLGVAATADSIRITTLDRDGQRRSDWVPSVSWQESLSRTYLTPTPAAELVYGNRATRYWARTLRDMNAVYVQVNSWDIGPGVPERSFAAFSDTVTSMLATPAQPSLILDFRWNTGGRIDAARHLLAAILGVPHLRVEGRLFAIASELTFSAAVLFLQDLERYTNVLVVGSPTAGRVNAHGDLKRFVLPHSGAEVRYSAVHMVRGDPWDRRPTIRPDLPTPFSVDAYRRGVDPSLLAIAQHVPRTPVARAVLDAYRRGGADAATRRYERLRQDSAQRYAFDEFQLDAVADSLLAARRLHDAVKILKLNASEYPYVGWIIFNLAEAYRAVGDRRAALAHYEAAFALDKRLGVARDHILTLRQELGVASPPGG